MKIWNISQDNKCNPIHHTLVGAFRDLLDEYADESPNGIRIPNPKNIPVQKARIFDSRFGLVCEFSDRDFINKSSYRGAQKLYKCNSTTPRYSKKYCGKSIGMIHMIGFKIYDYDITYNVLCLNNIKNVGLKFINEVLVPKMKSEFPKFPDYMFEKEYDLEKHIEKRGWLRIANMTPQEKIVLANKYNVEAFPDSFYENDRGSFQKRVIQSEYDSRLEGELVNISDIRDYEGNENESSFEIMEKTIMERERNFQEVRDGFDYGDFQEFSDIYTRTETRFEDYELYPIRTNCLPKAIRKRGKSPYDTKLGVREYRYFNHYQKSKPLNAWKWLKTVDKIPSNASPKYHWEMDEKEIVTDEYDLPDSFWEDIEMAYQHR